MSTGVFQTKGLSEAVGIVAFVRLAADGSRGAIVEGVHVNTVKARVWRFEPRSSGQGAAWIVGSGQLPVGLAQLVHINALACDLQSVVDLQTKELEARLLLSYVDAPGGSSLQLDHQSLMASSRHIRSFVSECAGLGLLTAASEALFSWTDGTHELHSFDALPRPLSKSYQGGGVRPDLLFHVPEGPIAGEARGRYRKQKALLPKRLLAEQRRRLAQLTNWSAAHGDHSYFMSWVYVGPAGVAVDIFIPEASGSVDTLLSDWADTEDGDSQEHPFYWGDSEAHAASGTNVPSTNQQSPTGPTNQQSPTGAVGRGVANGETKGIETLGLMVDEPTRPPQEIAEEAMSRLYVTAPQSEQEATLAGISVRGRWVPADALGPAKHEVLVGVLAERPPRQVAIRERMARSEGRFDVCLDGRLLTVVRPVAAPKPGWRQLERALFDPR
ncbi:hypothetical protein ABZ826_12920 [Streptomyces sp. NPDC047515]|uniref:hypothetical protein n=1 Tax=Streptomyces sp. NPDC047515 TaxID=3155380 RepID=UPI0033F4BBE0